MREVQGLQGALKLVAALVRQAGDARAAAVAEHTAHVVRPLREAALALGAVSAEQFAARVDPLQKPGLLES